MKKILMAFMLLLLTAAPAMAKVTFQLPANFTQDDFKNLSRDLGIAISYVPLAPAEPLGGTLPGFDIGVEVTGVSINKNASYIQKAVTNPSDVPSTIPEAKAHVQVGLPFIPIDLGIVYGASPDNTDYKLVGYEIKWAILKGSTIAPAVAIRGAYTKLSGIDVFDISTKSLDLSISKGFAMLTPYAGIGEVWITSTPNTNVPVPPLTKEDITETKGFVGCKLSFGLINFVAEADFATVNSYSLRMNLHF
ncbi:MAG TPA: hypothetical protein VEJ22_03320 [Nitrospirota bacterium]|nr:hypothetical protein [Nitrospirota bacterium]